MKFHLQRKHFRGFNIPYLWTIPCLPASPEITYRQDWNILNSFQPLQTYSFISNPRDPTEIIITANKSKPAVTTINQYHIQTISEFLFSKGCILLLLNICFIDKGGKTFLSLQSKFKYTCWVLKNIYKISIYLHI